MDTKKAAIGLDVTDKSLRNLLNEIATIMPLDTDTSNWCYLPYWFNTTNNKVIAYHLNQLPDDLVKQIESYREILKPTA